MKTTSDFNSLYFSKNKESNKVIRSANHTFSLNFTDSTTMLCLLKRKDFKSFRQSLRREHVSLVFSEDNSLLHYTVATGDRESVQRLLHLGAEVNCQSARGYTPLIVAVLHRSQEEKINPPEPVL